MNAAAGTGLVISPAGGAGEAAPNILADLHPGRFSNANTVIEEALETASQGATPPLTTAERLANAPAAVERPARCERERAELRAIMRPEELARLTPAMRINYEIMQLESEIAATCGPCDAARKKIEILRAQKPGLIPSTRFGAKKQPGACDYLDKDLRVYVYFVRHSESCANVLKRNTTAGGLAQKFFPDPELSGRGVAMVQERARLLSAELGRLASVTQTEATSRSKLIVCSSSLFRAQQTAMYLSNGLTDADRISDRVVVLPYIQETGFGQENTALPDTERERLGLYSKLPGGAVSKGRIATDLFATAPNASTPDVEGFFEWLRCNIKTVYEAAAGILYPAAGLDAIRLLVVSHTGTMTAVYKQYAKNLTTIKHDNLEGMEVGFRIKASSTGGGMGPVTILIPRVPFRPSVSIPPSCPDSTCRIAVCSSSAATKGAAGIINEGDETICSDLTSARNIVARGTGPLTANNWGSLKPIVKRLGANTRPPVKALRKELSAFEPAGAFTSFFGRKSRNRGASGDPTSILAKIDTTRQYFKCATTEVSNTDNIDNISKPLITGSGVINTPPRTVVGGARRATRKGRRTTRKGRRGATRKRSVTKSGGK